MKVGIVSASDGRERVHQGLLPVITAHVERLSHFLRATGVVEILRTELFHSPEEARSVGAQLRAEGAQALIVCQPVFGFPHNAISLVRDLALPTLLFAPWEPDYPALVGLLTIGGGLAQIGVPHARVWGSIEDLGVQRRILGFCRGAGAVSALRGRVVGQLGGRSMGLYTTAADGAAWQAQFGVDLDHADQIEIVRRAGLVPPAKVDAGLDWLNRRVEIQFDGTQLTPERLAVQVRSYLATRDIARDLGWDAVALKCHYEMSEFQVIQCLTAALMNDPYDWEGAKEPIPTACEADADGALTMLVMKLASGLPTALLDLRFFDADRGLYVLSNCGAAPTCFACTDGGLEACLSRTTLTACTPKYLGGGAHVCLVFDSGPVTLARLTRDPQGYRLLIAAGEVVNLPLGEVVGSTTIWPHAFVRLGIEPQGLLEVLHANHVHLVRGDFRLELEEFCRFSGIRATVV